MALTLFGNDISDPSYGQQSFSGLPKEYGKSILDKTVPQFLDSLSGYDDNINKSTQLSSDLVDKQTRNALNGGDITKLLNSLSGRGVLQSQTGGTAIGQALSDIINKGAERKMGAELAGNELKAKKPELLGSAVELGKTSQSGDPLASYKLLSDLYQSLL